MSPSVLLSALLFLTPFHLGIFATWAMFFQDDLTQRKLTTRSLLWLMVAVALDLVLVIAAVRAAGLAG
jgi:hypothetical protein